MRYDYEQDYNSNLHVPSESTNAASIPFKQVGEGRFVIYVPEYSNVDGGAKRTDASNISVKFAESDKTYAVDFKYYSSALGGSSIGDWFDLRRNYYYRFLINKSNEDADLNIVVDLYPYTVYILDPGFGQ